MISYTQTETSSQTLTGETDGKHMNICLVSFKVFLCGIFITTKTIVDFLISFYPLAKVLKTISLLSSIRDVIKDILRYMSSQ